jgi:hypothetical protein
VRAASGSAASEGRKFSGRARKSEVGWREEASWSEPKIPEVSERHPGEVERWSKRQKRQKMSRGGAQQHWIWIVVTVREVMLWRVGQDCILLDRRRSRY